MKWIKLFENFENDMLDDTKDILRLHLGELEEVDFIGGDIQVQMSDKLKDRIRVYRILESPNVRDLKSCEVHLKEETEGVSWNISLDWYNDKIVILSLSESVESFLVEWLRERFSGLNKYVRKESEYKNQILYIEGNGTGVFYYYEDDKSVYVSFQKIWAFFKTVLSLEDSQIRKILHDWILVEFNLDLEPKMW